MAVLTPLRPEAVSFPGCFALEHVLQRLGPQEGALVENPCSRVAPQSSLRTSAMAPAKCLAARFQTPQECLHLRTQSSGRNPNSAVRISGSPRCSAQCCSSQEWINVCAAPRHLQYASVRSGAESQQRKALAERPQVLPGQTLAVWQRGPGGRRLRSKLLWRRREAAQGWR